MKRWLWLSLCCCARIITGPAPDPTLSQVCERDAQCALLEVHRCCSSQWLPYNRVDQPLVDSLVQQNPGLVHDGDKCEMECFNRPPEATPVCADGRCAALHPAR